MPDVISQGIQTALSSNATLISLLGGTVIYRDIAPESAESPYIVYFARGGGEDNSTPRNAIDQLWVVYGVTSNDAALAGSIADEIRTSLHRQDLTFADGWQTVKVNRAAKIEFNEQAERRVFFNKGGSYRIRAIKES